MPVGDVRFAESGHSLLALACLESTESGLSPGGRCYTFSVEQANQAARENKESRRGFANIC